MWNSTRTLWARKGPGEGGVGLMECDRGWARSRCIMYTHGNAIPKPGRGTIPTSNPQEAMAQRYHLTVLVRSAHTTSLQQKLLPDQLRGTRKLSVHLHSKRTPGPASSCQPCLHSVTPRTEEKDRRPWGTAVYGAETFHRNQLWVTKSWGYRRDALTLTSEGLSLGTPCGLGLHL